MTGEVILKSIFAARSILAMSDKNDLTGVSIVMKFQAACEQASFHDSLLSGGNHHGYTGHLEIVG